MPTTDILSQVNKTVNRESKAKEANWDEAIADVSRKLELAKKRVSKLESAIDTFKRHKEQGYAWPRKSATRS
jgi:hypothetical protein